jgi:hypothetical protein
VLGFASAQHNQPSLIFQRQLAHGFGGAAGGDGDFTRNTRFALQFREFNARSFEAVALQIKIEILVRTHLRVRYAMNQMQLG